VRTDGKEAEALEALIAADRHGARHIKSVKLTDDELERVSKFQELLSIMVDPRTGRTIIPKNEFSALFQFCFNVTFSMMAKVVEEITKAEGVTA